MQNAKGCSIKMEHKQDFKVKCESKMQMAFSIKKQNDGSLGLPSLSVASLRVPS